MYVDGISNVDLTAGMVRFNGYVLGKYDEESKQYEQVPAGQIIMSPPAFINMLNTMTTLAKSMEERGLIMRAPQ